MTTVTDLNLTFIGYYSCPRGLANEEAHTLLGLVHRVIDGKRLCLTIDLAQQEEIRRNPPKSNPPEGSDLLRAYTYGGSRSHYIPPLSDLNNFPYTPAFCGYSPEWPSRWLGTGSQDEIDEAVTQQICRSCDRAIRGRRDLHP